MDLLSLADGEIEPLLEINIIKVPLLFLLGVFCIVDIGRDYRCRDGGWGWRGGDCAGPDVRSLLESGFNRVEYAGKEEGVACLGM